MIIRYHQGLADENYDSIVIGSGMGGLATAGILARHGQRVLVLEKHNIAGGMTHAFKRKRFEWDVGLNSIGNVHKSDHILRQAFDYITDGQLEWNKISEPYEKVVIGEGDQQVNINVKAGKDGFISSLVDAFPNERIAIETYVGHVCKVDEASEFYFAERLLPRWIAKFLYPVMTKKFRYYSDQTTLELLESITSNQALIKALTATYGSYGLPPGQSSFAVHALVIFSYFDGANYPVGGTSKIANSISDVVSEAGGHVVTKAHVKNIVVEKNKAVGVEMADGLVLRAKNIISNAGYKNTMQSLLPPSHKKNVQSDQTQSSKIKNSAGHINLFIGLNGSAEDLGLDDASHWVHKTGDSDQQFEQYLQDSTLDFPFVFISSPSTKDPNWSGERPNISTVTIIVPAAYAWFEKWKDKPWGKRGDDYDELKEIFKLRLIEELYRHWPKTKGKVAWQELSTPLSTVHFAQRAQGEVYGYDHTPERFQQRCLRPASSVRGLFLVGQDMVTLGVTASLTSAILATSLILRKNMMTAIPKLLKQHSVQSSEEVKA